MTGSDTRPHVGLVLASASPARLETLRRAGVEPVVIVSGVDEEAVQETRAARLAATLATMKARAVLRDHPEVAGDRSRRVLVLGCDSVLDVDGVAHGKPGTPEVAAERLRAVSGRSAVLHTGHHVIDAASGREVRATASTRVDFAELSDPDIAAYVATGEPLNVAGAFTIDGLGGAFVRGVDGDPHNVVGVSLPLLREMLAELGVAWPDLWGKLG